MKKMVNKMMTDGIEASKCVVVFITENYIDALGGQKCPDALSAGRHTGHVLCATDESERRRAEWPMTTASASSTTRCAGRA